MHYYGVFFLHGVAELRIFVLFDQVADFCHYLTHYDKKLFDEQHSYENNA